LKVKKRFLSSKEKRWANIRIVLIFLFLLSYGCLYIHLQNKLVLLGYSINKAMREKEDLSKKIESLKQEIASLKSPSSLEKKAKALGLIEGNPEQVVKVGKSYVDKW